MQEESFLVQRAVACFGMEPPPSAEYDGNVIDLEKGNSFGRLRSLSLSHSWLAQGEVALPACACAFPHFFAVVFYLDLYYILER